MKKFIKAESGLQHSVLYEDESGKFFCYSGGTWAWRNHNPGNLHPGHVSARHGQIGKAGKFAVFPDYESGHQALIDCLLTTYGNDSISQMIKSYAPKNENDVKRYRGFLQKYTGVFDDKKIKDFAPEEFEKLWKGIGAFEGYEVGDVAEMHKIICVKEDRHDVYSLQVESLGWLSKDECISLVNQKQINLVACHSKLGNPYLRSRPLDPFQKELSKIVVDEFV